MALLYGRQYAGNNLVVAILALNLLVFAAAFPFSRALIAIERADLDFLVSFVALFIMVAHGILAGASLRASRRGDRVAGGKLCHLGGEGGSLPEASGAHIGRRAYRCCLISLAGCY